jgi:hypothetical protein
MGTLLKVKTCEVQEEIETCLTGEDGCSEVCSTAGVSGATGDETAGGLRWGVWTDEEGPSSVGYGLESVFGVMSAVFFALSLSLQ